MIEGSDEWNDAGIIGARLHRDCALADGRREILERNDRGSLVLVAETLQAGQRQQRCMNVAGFQLAQPCLNIAAESDDLQVRPGAAHQRLTAQRGRADDGAVRQVGDRSGDAAQENVAHVLAFQEGGEDQAVGEHGRHVLGGMHGDVGAAVKQRLLDFLGEQPLAAGLGQGPVLDAVAAGLQDEDLGHLVWQAVGGAQPGCDLLCLGEGERATPRCNTDRCVGQVALFGMTVGIGADYRDGQGNLKTASEAKSDMGVPGLRVLGIETSCDETAAAVVLRDDDGASRGAGRVLSNVVLSQLAEHAPYGGVVPEIAARAHIETLDGLIAQALEEAGCGFDDLDGIAATAGPGLIGGLLVGLMTGKAIAAATAKPFVAVNHLEGHALTARLTDGVAFPYLLLLVTGGHTQILKIEDVGRYRRWGTTLDDAVGEAFDKVAKMLGLGWPGGPAVERLAEKGDPARFAFPRPMTGRAGCDFSFSGLKTAVRLEAQRIAPLSDTDVADLCASFQAAVVDCLAERTERALSRFVEEAGAAPVLVVAGGVAANSAVRARLDGLVDSHGASLVAPPLKLCGDNAAMIAWAGCERLARGNSDSLDAPARARWSLEEVRAA